MELQLTELLNIPGLVVEYYRNFGQELILDVEVEADYSSCPNCGQVSNRLHQNHGDLVRDFPLSNRQVFLKVNRRINLLNWLEKAASFFQKTVKTIKNWFGEIVGYFEKRTTQGVVEGINNKLKLIKRS
jgi:transposase